MSDTFIQDRCAIFLADLPRSIDGDKIGRLHMAYGLPMPVDFQLLHDSSQTQASCAGIFRYTDPTTANGALEVFSGLPVECNGRYWPLRAKLAGMKIPDRGFVQPKEMPKAPPEEPVVLLREVPGDWSQKDLMSFHLSLGMEEFQTAKLMPSSDGGATRHAYLQYRTAAAASNAVRSLSGSLVHPRSGEPRRLIAGLASDLRPSGPGQNGTRAQLQGPGRNSGYRNQARDQFDPFEAGPQQDPYTLYLSDMPSDFNKQDLERLHDQLGLNKPKSIKVLYLRLNKSKSSAVLRYDTTEQAKHALMVLQDRLVLVNEHSGEEQHPRAQFARKRAALPPSQDDNSFGGSDHEDRDEDDTIYSLPSVYVAELPVNITENGVRHMVQEVGGKLEDLVAVTFLQQKFKGSHACCLLRYQDMEIAESMAQKLHGFRVYHPDDRTRPVRAKVAKHSKAVNYMCTDVYVGEVPNNWTASYMYKFLTQAGVDRSVIHSVKLLSQRPGRAGIGAILHIVSAEAADRVLEQLSGQEILVRGKPRPLKVRLADAPKEPWMPEQSAEHAEPPQLPQPPPVPEITEIGRENGRRPSTSVPVPLSQLQ